MKITLALEEFAMLLLGIFAFSRLDFAWWWFLVLFFTPDFGMLGYLFNNKIGALIYNLFHHKGLAVSIWGLGFYLQNEVFQLIGVILFSHAAFDRILGYGLKYEKGFKFTHLGEIGN
tara:strand:- start:81 stop:431 length:351 start_codon:yes stop_codon:yes gene_type:complete